MKSWCTTCERSSVTWNHFVCTREKVGRAGGSNGMDDGDGLLLLLLLLFEAVDDWLRVKRWEGRRISSMPSCFLDECLFFTFSASNSNSPSSASNAWEFGPSCWCTNFSSETGLVKRRVLFVQNRYFGILRGRCYLPGYGAHTIQNLGNVYHANYRKRIPSSGSVHSSTVIFKRHLR